MKVERIYLDIETIDINKNAKDAFDPMNHKLTVVGLLLEYDDNKTEVIQFVFDDEKFKEKVSEFNNLMSELVKNNPEIKIVGYNIVKFDVPVLYYNTGFNPPVMMLEDLMFACWKYNLRGGLKRVCQQLGISRPNKTECDGVTAKFMWLYYRDGNKKALEDLLKYNKDDLFVLKSLMEKLKSLSQM